MFVSCLSSCKILLSVCAAGCQKSLSLLTQCSASRSACWGWYVHFFRFYFLLYCLVSADSVCFILTCSENEYGACLLLVYHVSVTGVQLQLLPQGDTCTNVLPKTTWHETGSVLSSIQLRQSSDRCNHCKLLWPKASAKCKWTTNQQHKKDHNILYSKRLIRKTNGRINW